MKVIIGMLALGIIVAACSDNAAGGGGSHSFKTTEDSVSYAIGMNIGKGVKADSIKIDPDLLAAGIRDAQAGKPAFTDTVAQNVLMAFQQVMMKKQQERMQRTQDSMAKAGEGNKKKAEAFLAQNKTKPNVVTLPNGLQYEVLTEGTGAIPKASDMVKVNYRGTLEDGTEFDASKDKPAQFGVSGVIAGWSEALKMMKVGSKWRLWIPPDLGYGMNPPPGAKIPPGAVLIFEVELVEIVKATPAAGGMPGGEGGAAPQVHVTPAPPGH